MTTAPLLLALLALPGDPVPLLDDARRDALFTVAVESWVYESFRPRRFDSVVPPPLLDAVRSLGCDRHGCRELASSAVRSHPEGVRAAFWASRSGDAEVRRRGVLLLRGFLACPHCNNSGFCPVRAAGSSSPMDPYADCRVCDLSPFPRWYARFFYEDHTAWRVAGCVCANCDSGGDLLFLADPARRPRFARGED